MVDRTQRPIVPVAHTNEVEHRRQLAERANASFPKDGTEGMTAPLKLTFLTAAELTGAYAASLWEGAAVFVSDENRIAFSDGASWIRAAGSPVSLSEGGTGAVLVDPNADRIFFWDDSAGSTAFLAPNTGLVISGTDLNISTVPVANGGTGATTASGARTNLGLGSAAVENYEEGNWTPVVSFGGSTTGVTYSQQTGRYIRIGKLVLAYGRVVLTSNGSGVGDLVVDGLPFVSNSTNRAAVAFTANAGLGDIGPVWPYVAAGDNIIEFEQSETGVGIGNASQTDFLDNADFAFNCVYREA